MVVGEGNLEHQMAAAIDLAAHSGLEDVWSQPRLLWPYLTTFFFIVFTSVLLAPTHLVPRHLHILRPCSY